MTASPRSTSTERPHARRPRRPGLRRGAVMVEMALILFFLVFFMFMPLGIHTLFMADVKARTDAYRNAFEYVNAGVHANSVDRGPIVLAAATNLTRNHPVSWSTYRWRTVAALPRDNLDPQPVDDLRNYTDTFNNLNYQHIGLGSREARYWFGFGSAEALHFDRTVQVIRGPWGMSGLPVGHMGTQDFREGRAVRQWSRQVHEETIDDDLMEAFRLKPLSGFFGS